MYWSGIGVGSWATRKIAKEEEMKVMKGEVLCVLLFYSELQNEKIPKPLVLINLT